MTRHFKLTLLVFLLLLSACDKDPPPEVFDAKHNKVLVFVDASASSTASEETQKIFRDSMRQIVETYLPDSGDELTILPIHSQTVSKAGRWDTSNTVSEPDWDPLEQDRKSQEASYYAQRNDFIETAQERAVHHFESIRSNSEFQDWTDMWGTLEVISDEVSVSSVKLDTNRVKIYYFSDMNENPGEPERRDFDKNPPQSREQAISWAREDAEELFQNYKAEEGVFPHVSIRVIPGGLATKESARYVKYYWENLFTRMGVEEKQIEYN